MKKKKDRLASLYLGIGKLSPKLLYEGYPPPPLTLDLNKSTWYKISSHKNNFIRLRCDFN